MRLLRAQEHTGPEIEKEQILQLDITFDDSDQHGGDYYAGKTHLGIQSCLLVQSFLREFPYLREVAIVLKKFMTHFEYNHPYSGKRALTLGGISSYGLVLMLVAFYRF